MMVQPGWCCLNRVLPWCGDGATGCGAVAMYPGDVRCDELERRLADVVGGEVPMRSALRSYR